MSWNDNGRKVLFQTWSDMKQRCYNSKCKEFKNYGARGITVCERWLESFQNFAADMGQRPDGMSLDRIDNEKGYGPDNCRWASKKEQRSNQRTCHYIDLHGEKRMASEIASQYGMHVTTLVRRIGKGMTPEEAVAKPVNPIFKENGRKAAKAHWEKWYAARQIQGGDK